jgi:site-specific DNA recombinase
VIAAAKKAVRVAIYTRKSVTEGLDQEFNSLDAQREAVEDYVKSQRGAGWVALPERYDDGGFTGANTDRPAFKRLLADIAAGKVDVVATYRLDRLSRSLLDFTQLLDLFRRHDVAFVSVTQSFDTSTSMGRMVVSLLATFGEFERETIAERVRDKVHAARRRGMWTGGKVPLGYDVVEKKLIVNREQAERVRAIFALYLDIGALLPTAYELNARAWTSKAGGAWSNTSLHAFLTNPLYAGKIRAGSEVVEGQQDAIVDLETFDAVQLQLSRRAAVPRGWRPPKRDGALLAGLLKCACGSSMIRSSTKKHGRRYHSYVCARVLKHGAAACPGSRAPAGELEAFVLERVRAVGRDPAVLRATLTADREAGETRRANLEADLQRRRQERGRLEAEHKHLGDAVAAGAAGMVKRLKAVERELADLADAQRDRAALGAGPLDPEELQRALEEFEPLWAELSAPERARVLALLLEQVTFDAESGEIEIELRHGAPRLLQARTADPHGAGR